MRERALRDEDSEKRQPLWQQGLWKASASQKGARRVPRALVKGSKSSARDSGQWRLPTTRKEDHKEEGLREEVRAL